MAPGRFRAVGPPKRRETFRRCGKRNAPARAVISFPGVDEAAHSGRKLVRCRWVRCFLRPFGLRRPLRYRLRRHREQRGEPRKRGHALGLRRRRSEFVDRWFGSSWDVQRDRRTSHQYRRRGSHRRHHVGRWRHRDGRRGSDRWQHGGRWRGDRRLRRVRRWAGRLRGMHQHELSAGTGVSVGSRLYRGRDLRSHLLRRSRGWRGDVLVGMFRRRHSEGPRRVRRPHLRGRWLRHALRERFRTVRPGGPGPFDSVGFYGCGSVH